MKKVNKIFVLLIMISMILSGTNLLYGQKQTENLKVLWEKNYSYGNNLRCLPRIAKINTNNNTISIIGSCFNPKDPNSYGNAWYWEIDRQGEKIKDTVFKEGYRKQCVIIGDDWSTRGLSILPNGDILTPIKSGKYDSEISVMRTDREGSKEVISSIDDEKLFILKMVEMSDGNFLILGRDSNNTGLIIKIDSGGNKIWKKTYNFAEGNVDIFIDGESVGDKDGFVLVGNSLNISKELSEKTATTLLLKCDSQGEILSQKQFNGGSINAVKYPQICQLDCGNIALSYDNGNQSMVNTNRKIKVFTPNLELIREKQIVQSEDNLFFGMEAIPGGGFIVAYWGFSSDLQIYRFDNEGQQLDSISLDDVVLSSSFRINIVCMENEAFIIGTTPSIISDVKIIALELE